jgi:hypothetical protein
MDLVQVESSNVAAVGYDEEQESLYVEFKSGSTYKYLEVPFYAYEEMLSADSIGRYLNKEIKGRYEFTKL